MLGPRGTSPSRCSKRKGECIMDWKIEVVTIPVSDVDRARDFYVEKVGFEVDIDHRISDEVRLVQLTPPGSSCSVHLGRGTVDMEPGDLDGVFLVFDEGAYRPARDGEDLDYVGCVFFSDPDGNRWCVQQIPARD